MRSEKRQGNGGRVGEEVTGRNGVCLMRLVSSGGMGWDGAITESTELHVANGTRTRPPPDCCSRWS
ncbi:hypothetical protein BKA80DRAFT_281162, partial [Phyllosticta citrichinensis]